MSARRIGPDVLYGTVADLGRGLRTGEHTSVELAEAYLVRLERFGPSLNAVAAALGLAMEYQRRTDWHRRHPEL